MALTNAPKSSSIAACDFDGSDRRIGEAVDEAVESRAAAADAVDDEEVEEALDELFDGCSREGRDG